MTAELPPRPTELHNANSQSRRVSAGDSNEFASFAAQLAAREKRLAGGAMVKPLPSVDGQEESPEEATGLLSILASHRIAAGVLLLVTASVVASVLWGLPSLTSTPLPSSGVEQTNSDVAAVNKREVTVLSSVPAPSTARPVIDAPPASPQAPSPASTPPVSAAVTSFPSVASPPAGKEPGKSTPGLPPATAQIPSATQPAPAPLSPDEIRELQGKLKAVGFNPGAIDGVVGPQTRSAMRDYAQARSLPNADATKDLLARLRDEPVATVAPEPAPPQPSPQRAAPVAQQVAAQAAQVAQQVNKPTSDDSAPGLTPDDIRGLQDRLRAGGYYTGATDGVMGRQTRKAIREYAEAQGVPAGEGITDLLSH
jgi:peptidoglycan hydrolase-like protein with peptidoglycan-binding domain